MNPERWQEASRILEIALERHPERRAAYLDEVCANDERPASRGREFACCVGASWKLTGFTCYGDGRALVC